MSYVEEAQRMLESQGGVRPKSAPISVRGASELTICLDMDGVCTDFVGAALRLHGFDPEEFFEVWPEESYHIVDLVKQVTGVEMSYAEFWQPINEAGVDFWHGLLEYPHFKALWSLCQELTGSVYFLTSPSWDPASLMGKVRWMQDQFSLDFRDYVITNRKHLLAKPNMVLVDDLPEHADAFRRHGGKAIQFPRPYCYKAWPHDIIGLMEEQLQEIIDGLDDDAPTGTEG